MKEYSVDQLDKHRKESKERTLFTAVILQDLIDATKPEETNETSVSVINRDRAKAWFFCSVGVTCDNFEYVCEMADLNPSYTRSFAYKVIQSKEIKYIRKRINTLLSS